MSRIIKALLLISKIENDQYLKQERTSVTALLDEVLEEVEERLQEKEIRLYKHFYEDIEYGPCNKTLLFTMFMNLVNNAIKYNKEGGSLMITTRKVNGQLQVEVKDTGIGMEKAELPSIFDRFKRLNKSKADGYGLGLPIVKTIAGFHQIEIKVDSEPEVGTVFTLLF
jgi:signal transduction histidine kinase